MKIRKWRGLSGKPGSIGNPFKNIKSRNFSYPKYNRPKLDSKKLIILTYFASFTLVGMVLSIFGIIGVFAYYSRELPNPNQLLERSEELSTKILDRNGNLIYEVYGEKNRELIKLDQVSPHIVHATLSVEDAEFYTHQGYSIRGMLRALKNTFTGEGLQGGSTLTQQVVKNALLTQDRTLPRKIKEMILSLQLENRYDKDQIIQMYLNETPYGGQNYGIVTSARSYFNKHPKDLTVAEAAYLAGLPQRPSYYSRFGSDPEAGIERKNYVLYLMKERGWIEADGKRYYLNEDEYTQARDTELDFQASSIPFKAPHFVFYIRQLLAEKFGEEKVEQGGLQVTTSLDLDLHDKVQQIVFEEIEKADQQGLNIGNGGAVVLDSKTGQILSMVGSKGYFLDPEPEDCISGAVGENSCTFDPYLNVTLAPRQPGSSIKPITYATMLSQGYTSAFPFVDVPTSFPGSAPDKPYIPVNYDGRFRGPMSLRKSLGNSLNIPAVKALKIAGIDNMIDLSEKMGITTLKDRKRYGLALTLGGGETKLIEMTGAFSVFANKGIFHEPAAIVEVKDVHGNSLYKWRDTGGTKALGEDVAFLISDILSDDGARSDAFGAGSLLNIPGHRVAVKTGTTDDKRDNYAMGFTPSYTVGVWVGNNNNDRMNPNVASGISGATPIWRRTMIELLADKTPETFEPPSNVKKFEVDAMTGMTPNGDETKRSEWFISGTEPTAPSTWYQRLEICKVDKRLANNDCRDADRTEVKTFVKITAELPEWQTDVDKWVQEHYTDSKYFPPTTVSRLSFDDDGDPKESDNVYVDIIGLKDDSKVGYQFRLSVEASSSRSIREVRIYLDDKQVTADKSEPFGYNFSFTSEQKGKHTFKAVAEDSSGNKGEVEIDLIVGE